MDPQHIIASKTKKKKKYKLIKKKKKNKTNLIKKKKKHKSNLIKKKKKNKTNLIILIKIFLQKQIVMKNYLLFLNKMTKIKKMLQ